MTFERIARRPEALAAGALALALLAAYALAVVDAAYALPPVHLAAAFARGSLLGEPAALFASRAALAAAFTLALAFAAVAGDPTALGRASSTPWRRLALVLGPLLLAPAALAQAPSGVDATVLIAGDAAPSVADGRGALAFVNHSPREHYRFDLRVADPYWTVEVRATGLGLERARQLVPLLLVDANESACAATKGTCEYPLFEAFPNERIWEVDGPGRVFWSSGSGDDLVLRLGVPGPVNATLVLQRDERAPGFTLGAPQNVTHFSFYMETRTDELAWGDLQVRKADAGGEWVRNPTPVPHVLQRYPVQGLDAASTYDARVAFKDWAGNVATSETFTVTTLTEPIRPRPIVAPLAPAPNATVEGGAVVVRASVESPESPIEDVRVFFDKREVTQLARVEDGVVTFAAGALEPGRHSVSVEARNAVGGEADARWAFDVAGEARAAPGLGALATLAVAAALVAVRRR